MNQVREIVPKSRLLEVEGIFGHAAAGIYGLLATLGEPGYGKDLWVWEADGVTPVEVTSYLDPSDQLWVAISAPRLAEILRVFTPGQIEGALKRLREAGIVQKLATCPNLRTYLYRLNLKAPIVRGIRKKGWKTPWKETLTGPCL